MSIRLIVIISALCVAGTQLIAAVPIQYSPDVPTDPGTGVIQLPWEIRYFDGVSYGPAPLLTAPGMPRLDAVHKLDLPGGWLLSLELPSDLGGALPGFADHRDVVRFETGSGYSLFFCGGSVTPPIPLSSNVDAVYLDPSSGGDFGDLILSFDVPTELPAGSGSFYLPADLVRFARTGPGCSGWTFAGRVFDSLAAGVGIPPGSNVIGAALRGGKTLFVLDVPTSLTPSAGGPTVYVPGEVVSWDGAVFDRFETLPGWPIGSRVQALSCGANPGAIPLNAGQLRLARSLTSGDLRLDWPRGCSAGAEDYAIYEGVFGNWTSHSRKRCSTSGATTAEITPSAGDAYYLVVPISGDVEGSYGRSSSGAERPRAAAPVDRCVPAQSITPCP